MHNATLIDAGPLIAALNPRDRDHARCIVFLAEFTGTFVTTWPVVTEASLVALATQMGLSEIVLIDSDLEIYRLPNNSRLKNRLAGAPPRGRKK